ncbi:MAG: hypothetical protein ACLF0P_14620, partial [Thermoanaerobaculia bacterium]
AGLGTAEWRVTALPAAAAVAAGAALAGGGSRFATDGPRPASAARAGLQRLVPVVAALAAAAVLAPGLLAHRWYDRAEGAPRQSVALRSLDRAVALDPDFPLYRARRAWLRAEGRGNPGAAPRGDPAAMPGAAARTGSASRPSGGNGTAGALAAAEAAVAVAPLWLAAGSLEAAAGSPWSAAAAFERACALDPLGALAPFGLLEVESPLHDPVALGARSLAAEPRLAAATSWAERTGLLDEALGRLAATGGLDAGWRTELVRRVRQIESQRRAPPGESAPSLDRLVLAFDRNPAESASLVVFRRRPWPARIAGVAVRSRAARVLAEVPPATTLQSSDAHLFPPTCIGPFAPQELRKTLRKTW